ncbi:hypothetical protein DACRYDRAFT_96659 [Dacryopinax primogenitus]|uniref:Uncharacterized protein n=1 Tax=Dacryopinax primogenitus (strain DJM 731) TaxID=1858805 RepID=M5FRZ2_DACPD|nr:uncharacterized protein DACRYDRAFT_96659 [Dacryopinax primogenitus]EJT98538.1 hypothetical protein DACRYDRAFT_96659 [Dacryopinax primogenitus]
MANDEYRHLEKRVLACQLFVSGLYPSCSAGQWITFLFAEMGLPRPQDRCYISSRQTSFGPAEMTMWASMGFEKGRGLEPSSDAGYFLEQRSHDHHLLEC